MAPTQPLSEPEHVHHGLNPWVELSSVVEPLDPSALLPGCDRLALDLGAGDGGFASAWAKLHPRTGVLAVERLLGRARKIVRKAVRLRLHNLRVLRLESFYTIKYLLPASSVDEIHIMHPDPWPKKRHHKHRLCTTEFFLHCARILRPAGVIYLTTDHSGYIAHALREASHCPLLLSQPWVPGPGFPLSDFERNFRSEGKLVFRQAWRRSDST